MILRVEARVLPELYALVAKDADEKGMAMCQVLVRIVADYYGKPELGRIPRAKRDGRRRYYEQEVTQP